MPTKPNKAGQEQNYVPAGNGDASGEYADNATGSNIHWTNFLKSQVDGEVKTIIKEKFKPEPSFDSFKKSAVKEEEKANKEEIGIEMPKKKKSKIKVSDKDIDNYTEEECYEVLVNKYNGQFDEEKISKLNKDELHEILKAKKFLEQKKEIENPQLKVNQYIKDNNLGGIWYHIPEDVESMETSIDKKIDYFKNEIESNFKNADHEKFLQGQIDKLEKMKSDLKDTFEEWKEYDDLLIAQQEQIDKANDFIGKYENKEFAYSQEKKNKAKWFKSKSGATNFYSPYAQKQIEMLKKENPQGLQYLEDYTGSYSSINNPLRKINYAWVDSTKKAEFMKRVKGMTEALDKCSYDFDCWVQRGVGQLQVGEKLLNYGTTIEELKKLEGTTFEDQGFMSCGSSKGAGFASSSIIMNIYCPKGTKMIFAQPFSHYASENESIIQRGYSYKITKVEKTDGKTYLDVEVILGSDSKKYNDKELEELKEKHIKG